MPTTVPNRPTNGAVEPMVARTLRPLFSLAWTMASARSRARCELSMVSSVGHTAGSAELLQAGGHDFGQVRLLVAVGDLDRFFELAVLQRAGNLGRELARLLAGGGEVQVTVDHHGERPDRLDEQEDGHAAGQPCHVVPQPHGAEADRLLLPGKAPGC